MPYLLVFHQGFYQNHDLWYSYFDGTNWSQDYNLVNVGIAESASAVVFPGGGISVFHQGGYPPDGVYSGQLWYCYFDGTNWGPDTQVPNLFAPPAPLMSGSPSAVLLPAPAGAVSVFYQGQGDDGQLWYSYWDGTNWVQTVQVPNVGISESPAAVLWANGIIVFH